MGTVPSSEGPELLAPQERKGNSTLSYLYTVAFVLLLLAFSFVSQTRVGSHASRGHVLFYAFTIVWEFILLGLVYLGARLARLTFRELIGGRWNRFEDFLLDVVIAAGFWIVSDMVLVGLGYLLGLSKAGQTDEVRQLLQTLAPHNVRELIVWILLSSTAGFCEEIIFRGYLQRQLASMLGNVWGGMLVSAAVFGLSHAYEGHRRMLLIAIYGALFGTLAILRKSLRPGMMAHAWHDSFAGVGLFFYERMMKSGVIK